MTESIKLENGKYEVIVSNNGSDFHALRFGEEWRDLTGDKMIMAMFYRIQKLEEISKNYFELCNRL